MRYIEETTKSGKSIFEGDELVLKTEGVEFGNSYVGQLCYFFNVDEIKVKVIDNEDFLAVKYNIQLFKDGKQIVTYQEHDYFFYISKYEKTKLEDRKEKKELEDFSGVKNAKELYNETFDDSTFFSYLVKKGLEKVSGFDGEAEKVEDSTLKVKSGLDFEVYLDSEIVVELDKKAKDIFEEDIFKMENELKVEEFTHAKISFKRLDSRFQCDAEIVLTDEQGEVKVFEKLFKIQPKNISKLHAEERKTKQMYKKEDTEENKVLFEKASKELKEVYEEESNIDLEPYNPWLGMSGEMAFLGYAIKNKFKISKLN